MTTQRTSLGPSAGAWLVWCGLLWALPAGAEPCLVRNGRAEAEIVIAPAPARLAKLAASELQHYVAKLSGATLPVVTAPTAGCPVQVYVGRSEHTDRLRVTDDGLLYGAFRMVSGPNWLVLLGRDRDFVPPEPWARSYDDRHRVTREWDALTGERWGNPFQSLHRRYSPALGIWEGDERGSFNAVNEFLRGLGVRWYAPGDLGEVVPQLPTIALPAVNRTVRPDLAVRHQFHYFHEFWTARKGDQAAIDDVLWQLRLGLFAYPEVLGHTIGDASVLTLCRPEVKQAHPEYFALWAGRRQTEHLTLGAPCLSSPGFRAQMVRFAGALFDHYHEPMVNLSPSDGYVYLCECPLCAGRATPDRGPQGRLSDYVWDYVEQVARELYRRCPDRKVYSTAYSAYTLPPERIARFSPNLAVVVCQNRSALGDAAARDRARALMQAWQAKLPSGELYIWDYYLHARPDTATAGVPVYYPHTIAADLRALKGVSRGDFVEVYRNWAPEKRPWDALAANHLNCYVSARLYWDASQDVDALLADYYQRYYGPARREMQAYVDYAEANWTRANTEVAVIDRLFALLESARRAAGDGVYGQRVAVQTAYVARLQQLRERLARGRETTAEVRTVPRERGDLHIDGTLNEQFWQQLAGYALCEVETGRPAHQGTWFRAVWADNALCLGIRCQDRDMAHVAIGSRQHGDPAIWLGDNVDILVETQTHRYYQLAVGPTGAVVSADRKRGLDTSWVAGAEVAATQDDDGWTIELRLPVNGEADPNPDPVRGLAGRRPTRTYPWFINVCRQRVRSGRPPELTAFAPTGRPEFHHPLSFALLWVP